MPFPIIEVRFKKAPHGLPNRLQIALHVYVARLFVEVELNVKIGVDVLHLEKSLS